MVFSGFNQGTRYTPVPNPVFGPLLEAIQDPAELKCTLRVLWLLHQKKGYPRYVTTGELLSDRVLQVALAQLDPSPQDATRRGMKLGVQRKTFISVTAEVNGTREEVYLLNDDVGRRGAQIVARGELGKRGALPEAGPFEPSTAEKPNVFALYEENIGVLTPLLAEEMKEAERVYPWSWVEEAFRLAVGRNKRNWRYIESTLRRWAEEGKDDGESGRHPKETPSTEELVEYLRERGRLPRA